MARWLAPLGLFLLWAFTLFAYLRLPERIPVHWNAQGEVDRWGSRLEVFLLPLLLTLLVYPLLALAPRLDPKLRGQEPGVWPWLTAGVVWTLALLQGVILYATWQEVAGEPFPLERALFLALGLVFLVLGLLLPRIPPNHFAGVRTPWTLESPEAWGKTQKRSGQVFALLGLLAWAVALLGGQGVWLWLWLAACALGVLYLVLYSYLVWRLGPKGP
ncbi:hypothetical protein TCCBUS3UF1_19930 [Thermus sp. CCB_US3_UF1]|uniref:DUF1648 domain-containing protein n=1 Tax=Thermus sp. CCB_US3_UF1 TaxID=1111069 RepID=UPI00023891B7|nr:DUF1648 domain-containing protein [Thermus sp. CCB_US3_UF1]AEV17031.1 hypothetical protein TCCBUS3UF1_19930 [Thermus sp. CCB_US3_UF1]